MQSSPLWACFFFKYIRVQIPARIAPHYFASAAVINKGADTLPECGCNGCAEQNLTRALLKHGIQVEQYWHLQS